MKDTFTRLRRHRQSNEGWLMPDDHHLNFVYGYSTALLRDVMFDPHAPAMVCVPGYDSTGEACGVLLSDSMKSCMPADAVVTHEIVYDRESQRFHVVGNPTQRVVEADYLVLQRNGKSFAGWKADSERAPRWLQYEAVTA